MSWNAVYAAFGEYYRTKDGKYEIPILCFYPISGQYGLGPRTLYYALLLVSLFLRGQPWISGGCLAVAMEYGGSAAIHVFALRARYKFGHYDQELSPRPASDLGDIDIIALWVIVSSACILMTPLLVWSTTIRKLEVRPILVYWGLLMYAAFICAAIPIGTSFYPYVNFAQATCTAVPGVSDCNPKVASALPFTYSQDWWRKCQCKDKCSLADSAAPFRTGASMVPALSPSSSSPLFKKGYEKVFTFSIFTMIFVAIQGLLAIIQSRWSQRRVRNFIFRHLSNKDPNRANSSFIRRMRQRCAKWIAAAFYISSIFSAICCFAFFFVNLVVLELYLSIIPNSDPPFAVGQWAPWVTLGLVIVTTLIKRYHSTVEGFAMAIWRRIRRCWRRRPDQELDQDRAMEQPAAPSRSIRSFILAPFDVAREAFKESTRRLKQQGLEFVTWFKDPVTHSSRGKNAEQEQLGDMGVELSNSINLPSSVKDDEGKIPAIQSQPSTLTRDEWDKPDIASHQWKRFESLA